MALPTLPGFTLGADAFPMAQHEHVVRWERAYQLLLGAERAEVLDVPARPLFPDLEPGVETDHIEDLPEAGDMNGVRLPVVASKLFLLGYLNKDMRDSDARDISAREDFRDAVGLFQAEAGLVVDHWVGRQTWEALSTLVSFETETRVQEWLGDDGKYRVAFRRALQLRLHTYGLAGGAPRGKFRSVPASNLAKARDKLSRLGGLEPGDSDEALFALLFDPDRLLALAAECAGGDEKDDPGLRRLLVNVVKIELWLLGLPAAIDGKDDYPVDGFVSRTVVRRRGRRTVREVKPGSKSLRQALEQFWFHLQGQSEADAASRAATLSPELFICLRDQQGVSDQPFEDIDYSRRLIETFEQRGQVAEDVANAWSEGRSLGMRLWDGLKRLWRWVRRGVEAIVSLGKNLYRAFFRFALKAYKIVRTGFTALGKGLEQYLRQRVELPEGHPVAVGLGGDLDFNVVLPRQLTPEEGASAVNAVQRFSAMFLFACRLVSLFTRAAISLATGLSGWVRLMMVLVKSYRDLVPAYRDLVAVI